MPELNEAIGFEPGEEFGVLFDIEGLGESSYGDKAWRLMCSAVHPSELQPHCYFFLGDTEISVGNRPYSFCIGIGVNKIFSNNAEPLEVFARKLWTIDDPGLAPREKRFIRGRNLRRNHYLIQFMSLFRDRLSVTDSMFARLLNIAKEEGWG